MNDEQKASEKNFTIKPDEILTIMGVSLIKTHKSIETLFDIKPETYKQICQSMEINGYDESQPVVIGRIKNIDYYLVDGHTRLKAAKQVGIEKISVFFVDFDSLEKAQIYAIKRQTQRRSLSQGEILIASIISEPKIKRDGSGRSVENLGKEMGISPATLVHAKTVAKNATPEDLQAIKDGKLSINSVYQKIRNKKKTKKDTGKVKRKNDSPSSIQVTIEDILRLLFDHNEKNAVNLILEKYSNSVSKVFVAEYEKLIQPYS